MRILYFDQYYPPEKASGTHLVQDLLDGMAEKGWRVDVFVPTPTRGVDDETRALYKKKRIEETRDGWVVVHRMRLMREGKNPLQRAFRFAVFSLECFRRALTEKYDVIFTGSGPPTQGCILGLASRIKGKPFVFNLQDIFPDSLVTTGLASKESLIWKIGRCIEDSSYKSAAKIITISRRMKENILAKGAEERKVSVVMNWEDLSCVKPVCKEENKLFEELGIDPQRFTVLYAGNLGASQNVISFLELAEDAKHLPIQFVVVGEGSELEKLVRTAEFANLTNIVFKPLQPLSRVAEVYSMADIAYISCANGVGKAGFPSKAWSIFATGRPVLASFDIDSDLGESIKSFALGDIYNPNDRNGRFDGLVSLYSDEERRLNSGQNARRFAERYGSREICVAKYLSVIESAVWDGVNDEQTN